MPNSSCGYFPVLAGQSVFHHGKCNNGDGDGDGDGHHHAAYRPVVVDLELFIID